MTKMTTYKTQRKPWVVHGRQTRVGYGKQAIYFLHCVSEKMHQLWNGIAEIIRIGFDDIWQKYSKYFIE